MYTSEDVAFERLKELQREMENSRLMASRFTGTLSMIRNLAARVWWLAGIAMSRPPRVHPVRVREARDDESAAPDAA